MCEIERRMLWRCRCYADVGEEEKSGGVGRNCLFQELL